MASGGDAARKITERSEVARREFLKKVEKIVQATPNAKLMQGAVERAIEEYFKLFGRLKVHPILVLGGKTLPRYLLERDEVWVIYKPPVWQMGGAEDAWMKRVQELVAQAGDLYTAEQTLKASDKTECLQEWHGLVQGKHWLDGMIRQWGFIQRLDIETDGPVIVGKTWRASRCLQVQMKEHVISKAYMCLVHGRLDNRVQFIKSRFAELGSDGSNQVMLKHDPHCDPFYNWTSSGKLKGRSIRQALTFFKPIAYYNKNDGSEYTLVYVNILSGITHQVRITMQSVGHPLVSDDRYLPKDQATADMAWCPRNFLVEVRSDWFDLCGPHKDPKRQRYTRISLENPLPKMFQDILEKKLTLVEKLDPTADLYVGCQYWAIGDEQLMNAYPKDDEYRRKVMRWGQRRGIHLDALDRLMLLPKEEIDEVLNNYRPADDKEEGSWICPKCMSLHLPSRGEDSETCMGYHADACDGRRVTDEDKVDLPRGWMNYLADPTIHFLFLVNSKWLEARQKVVGAARPAWERPPPEEDGTPATEAILESLEAALVLDAKSGGHGILEPDLLKVPGLQDIKLPLAAPPEDSKVQRVRLPGCGTYSRWLFTLKAKDRIKLTGEYKCKTQRLLKPVPVRTDQLPAKQVLTEAEKLRLKRQRDREEAELKKEKNEASAAVEEEPGESGEPAAKKPKPARNWERRESRRNPGAFYYVDTVTGEVSDERPADYKVIWERLESRRNKGAFYYHNRETGEIREQRPEGVEILNDEVPRAAVDVPMEPPKAEEEHRWERIESTKNPGEYFYYNSTTARTEVFPPEVSKPWMLLESANRPGQYFYYNEVTAETLVHPPPGARPAKGPPSAPPASGSSQPRPLAVEAARPAQAAANDLPAGWEMRRSERYNKVYYIQTATGQTSWDVPAAGVVQARSPAGEGLPPNWRKRASDKHPGKFYYQNSVTGETRWNPPGGTGSGGDTLPGA